MKNAAGVVIALILFFALFGFFGRIGSGGHGGKSGDKSKTPPTTESAGAEIGLVVVISGEEYIIDDRKVDFDPTVLSAIESKAKATGLKVKIVCKEARENQYRAVINACDEKGVARIEEGC